MQYYDRKKQEIVEEIEYQKKLLEFLYHTKLGRLLLKLFAARPWFSKLRALYQRSKWSKKDIKPFIEKYHINTEKWDLSEFSSFNDFFTRKDNDIPAVDDKDALIAIADAKLMTYKISDDLLLKIKNTVYSVTDILGSTEQAEYFKEGTCLVYRLAVNDYHRYHYMDNGVLISARKINGELHTVRPISEKYNVFTRNTRVVNILKTENFGTVAQVEVGALLVGKMVNHKKKTFRKNEEKGYFEFGGSTIVVFIEKEVELDEDIKKMNASGIEVQVKIGSKIGQVKEDVL